MTTPYKKKLIEVALPLEDINRDLPAPRLRRAGAAFRGEPFPNS
jgi:hypothetical protein